MHERKHLMQQQVDMFLVVPRRGKHKKKADAFMKKNKTISNNFVLSINSKMQYNPGKNFPRPT